MVECCSSLGKLCTSALKGNLRIACWRGMLSHTLTCPLQAPEPGNYERELVNVSVYGVSLKVLLDWY